MTQDVKMPIYAPNTVWVFDITVSDDYSLSGKLVEIELTLSGAAVFRYRSGEGSFLTITDQVVEVAIPPSLQGLDATTTFEEVIALGAAEEIPSVEFAIDFIDGTVTDYRMQGVLHIADKTGRLDE